MHILANEPSLAYYRLQENIRKSLPNMIDKRIEAEKLQRDLQGSIYDLEYAIKYVCSNDFRLRAHLHETQVSERARNSNEFGFLASYLALLKSIVSLAYSLVCFLRRQALLCRITMLTFLIVVS